MTTPTTLTAQLKAWIQANAWTPPDAYSAPDTDDGTVITTADLLAEIDRLEKEHAK